MNTADAQATQETIKAINTIVRDAVKYLCRKEAVTPTQRATLQRLAAAFAALPAWPDQLDLRVVVAMTDLNLPTRSRSRKAIIALNSQEAKIVHRSYEWQPHYHRQRIYTDFRWIMTSDGATQITDTIPLSQIGDLIIDLIAQNSAVVKIRE